MIEVQPVVFDPERFADLIAEGLAGDGAFLVRLRDEWRSGAIRFDRPGEILFGAFLDGELAGVGGLSLDPYGPAPGLGRVRHVYVLKRVRGRGIARMLMQRILDHAKDHFAMLRLSTQTAAAARLYEGLGFERVEGDRQTHRLRL